MSIRRRGMEALFILLAATAGAQASGKMTQWTDPDGRTLDVRAEGDLLWRGDLPRSNWNCTPWGGSVGAGANVYYQFAPTLSGEQQQLFLAAAQWWSRHADLEFFAATSGNRIYVEPIAGSVSDSFCGMIGGAQRMRLGEMISIKTAAHEIGHALGLMHEQSRPDQQNFIQVNYANINTDHHDQFAVSGHQGYGSYDFRSIMHYGRYAFSTNGQPSMTSVAPAAYCAPNDCNDVMGSGGPYPGGSPATGYLSPGDVVGAVHRYGSALHTGPRQAATGTVEVWVGQSPAIRESCATACRVHMQHAEAVSLRPVPASGHVFAGWIDPASACNSFQTNACTFDVAQNAEIHALFVPAGLLETLFAADDSDAIYADGFEP